MFNILEPITQQPITIQELVVQHAPSMREKMMEYAMDNIKDYFSENNLQIDWESVYNQLAPTFIEGLADDEFREIVLDKLVFTNQLFEEVDSRPHYFRKVESEMKENYKDLQEFERNPLAYNGLNQSDFF